MSDPRRFSQKLDPAPALFRSNLLAWYARCGRHDLPWRKTNLPYPILVSEFMLQQTTVATVIPYYERFLKTFPSIKQLATANVERVLELWSGLGYYARARNLHAAAQMVARDFRGFIPDTREAVESLPGVGKYTAGALLSLAFNKPEPIVDGNVARVLTRIYRIAEDIKDPKTNERLWAIAWKLVPPSGARAFNSALMDLGATVCRPSAPNCLVCPLFANCQARRHGCQEDIPYSSSAAPKKAIHMAIGIIWKEGKWFLIRRPPKGLYGGLWEFPGIEGRTDPTKDTLKRFLTNRFDFSVEIKYRLAPVHHVLSHRELHLHAWLCALISDGAALPSTTDGGWFSSDEIRGMAIATVTRRLMEEASLIQASGMKRESASS